MKLALNSCSLSPDFATQHVSAKLIYRTDSALNGLQSELMTASVVKRLAGKKLLETKAQPNGDQYWTRLLIVANVALLDV